MAILLKFLPLFGALTALAGTVAFTMGAANGISKRADTGGYARAVNDQTEEIEILRAENVALIAASDERVNNLRRQNDEDRAEERATFARQLSNARDADETLNVCLGLPAILPDGLRRETAAADPGGSGNEG